MKIHSRAWFLCAVLLFVILYSLSTLTTKPAYWYDEAINVELARNFADYGKLDLIIAPNTFSERGATVGSTGYTVTVPLAGFFRLFGFGLTEARVYMLLWMGALIVVFFFIARELWGAHVAYGGTLLLATFAPFYGNGRSVMGEIPGFLFFLCAFYLFERKRWLWSGFLLGLAVMSKPSVYVFLIPAFTLVILFRSKIWKEKIRDLFLVGGGAVLALVPWFAVYVGELTRGGFAQNIFNHFKNPYAEAGFSAVANISANVPTLVSSTTLLYLWFMLAIVIGALFMERELIKEHKHLLILSLVYLPLAVLQYLKSLGYLRYLIAGEFIIFILFLIALPVWARFITSKLKWSWKVSTTIRVLLLLMVGAQTVHLYTFADLYASLKTEKTIVYLYSTYPAVRTVGVVNVPQVASFIPAFQKYQYLSTYGLFDFGTRMLYLSPEKLPDVLISESMVEVLSPEERELLAVHYKKDETFTEGFSVYTRK